MKITIYGGTNEEPIPVETVAHGIKTPGLVATRALLRLHPAEFCPDRWVISSVAEGRSFPGRHWYSLESLRCHVYAANAAVPGVDWTMPSQGWKRSDSGKLIGDRVRWVKALDGGLES